MPRGTQPFGQYHGRLKAVVLDWAGTTVDFGSLAPVRTLQKVFSRASVALTELEARRDMGLPKKDHIRQILSIKRVKEEWNRLHGQGPSEADVEKLYEDFIPLQFSCLLEYSAVIPGVVEAAERFRRRELKIGSTTGYTREMLDLLVENSKKAGYCPDCSLSPGDVGAGRPHPYMIYETAIRLQVYPLAAIAKIGDTPVDIQEGLNAGAWSIGVAGTGNMIGLSQKEYDALPAVERDTRLATARAQLKEAGAHYVVDAVADLDAVLDDIEVRLRSEDTTSELLHKEV
ncbi:MAG TPA: phosphonoacetaldehyde hydrolase [Candidatus Eremiobacteraceae bacterium]|nr:phosphonoacetaldehyde hydrolase [Candidatus Eremiobacteraceae bacterium]